MFEGSILDAWKGKIINFHPSVLPDHPGKSAAVTSIQSENEYLGATVHIVDQGIDTGTVVVQTRFMRNMVDPSKLRHAIFRSQVHQLAFISEVLP